MGQYRVGVVLIGSLYWRDVPSRKSWRESRLEPKKGYLATAPIRYGRLSNSGTYTIVFSRGLKGSRSGAAWVVPCRQPVSTVEELIVEAKHLWTAERSAGKSDDRIAASWGCVALLVRPGLTLAPPFLNGWSEQVRREKQYGNIPQTKKEGILVDAEGLLRIDWPKPIGSKSQAKLDLLLVTANHPTFRGSSRRYPTPRMITEAWSAAADDQAFEYFRENRRHSICTFEDQKILQRLRKCFPALYESLPTEAR
jgi:hypothetical protein